jgi:hypothetical protein
MLSHVTVRAIVMEWYDVFLVRDYIYM